MSRALRDGKHVVFHNNTYDFFGDQGSTDGMVYIVSRNKDDIQNGFIPINVEYNKKYGFFQCQKEVPKNEITEAYEITTYANYKGFKLYIHGKKSDNMLTLLHTQMISSHSERDREIRDTLIEMGFYVFNVDKFGLTYAKDVPIDDPELEIFEERKEIDISKL